MQVYFHHIAYIDGLFCGTESGKGVKAVLCGNYSLMYNYMNLFTHLLLV